MTNYNINNLCREMHGNESVYLSKYIKATSFTSGLRMTWKYCLATRFIIIQKISLHCERLIWKQKDTSCLVTMAFPGRNPGITTAQPYKQHRNWLFEQRVSAGSWVVHINSHCALLSSLWTLPRFKQWWQASGTVRKHGPWTILQEWSFSFVFVGNHILVI